MRLIPLTLLATLCAAWQHSAWAPQPDAPDLVLALLTHVWVAGALQRAFVRACWVGLLVDAADPASTVFHLLCYSAAGAVYQGLARPIDDGPVARFLLAIALVCAVELADAASGGWAGFAPVAMAISAGWTGLASVAMAWLLDGVPEGLRPVAARERQAMTRLSLRM